MWRHADPSNCAATVVVMEGRIEPESESTRAGCRLGTGVGSPAIEPVVRLGNAGLSRGLSDMQERLDALLEQGPGTVVVDMSEVEQMSSVTVAALLWVKRRCSERRVHVVLRQPSQRSVNALLRIGLLDAGSRDPVATWGRTRMVLAASPGRS